MRYKEVLKKYGVTQVELAKRLGINRVSVARLINKKNDMRASTISKISAAIGCPAGELFDDAFVQMVDDEPKQPTITCPHCGKEIKLEVKK